MTAVALPVLVAVSCGGREPRPVSVTVDLGARPVTGHDAFGFTGHVRPAGSVVTVRRERGAPGPVVVEPSGRFSAAIGGLRPGTNVVRVDARRQGRRPGRRTLRIVRASAPPRVRVPEQDTSPPVALLVFRPGARLTVSPSAPRDPQDPVVLKRPMFRATGLVRDDGGAGRIRVSTTYYRRCGAQVRRRHRSFPPAQIVNVRLAPGAVVSSEETRTATIHLDPPPGCSVTGETWAEATDGHGLQAVSRHVTYRYGRRAPRHGGEAMRAGSGGGARGRGR